MPPPPSPPLLQPRSKEAGVGGMGVGGPTLVSALRQARSLALPSASLRLAWTPPLLLHHD